jgi:tetratricopeptide (TPR) repeat protein
VRLSVTVLLAAVACGGAGAEERADEAYVARRYADAYAAYRALAPEGRAALWSKAGAAAAAAGILDSAAAAYRSLAAADPGRVDEALEGLERTGRLAIRAANVPALRLVADGIVALDSVRPVGRFAYPLLSGANPAPGDAARLLPAALAAAPDAEAFDGLLLAWGRALEAAGDCTGAAEAYRGFLRRTAHLRAEPGVRERLTACAYEAGLASLEQGRAVEAERWLLIAVADSGGPEGRRALLALGDARLAQGDPIAAAIVWQRALRGDPEDSVAVEAARRIRRLADSDTAGAPPRMEGE